ncbi:hypothetical protein [Bacteroides cellulosilyticus]|jgi:hypothetical protein|uniref:Uncharacterized protein n=1 Tax=Bacteroides cellulosilyticus TaxID=246787 RepID=A0A642PPZ1_9BACE|nr:hypothetical protein [Bacteroides cellulosilyticus]KAA5412711.1 hypothetical protein F2Y81_24850 [Bacteroides cellulosilyticus]MBX9085695.1 hypothetical protein [Bacteroides cellulosilyticus]QUT91503.1 SMC_prok_A: chromosome segregation protein SMC [Bacteroides cellulosilyticus]DAM18308.1 MAG TPA: chromosome segregation ATPase [Caudoviricetes sp.]
MANNEDERILSIKVKYQDAINGILEYQNKLQALKKEQEKWKNEVVDGTKNFNEYNAAMADIKIQMAEAKDGIRVLEKEARNNLKTQQENEGSLKSLRAELSNSTKAYDEMSRTEREGAKGKELQDHINAVTNELNEAEQKTQRFYRNVGRYEDSVKDALISLQKQIQEADKEYNKLVKTEGEHAKSTKKAKKHLDELQLSLKFAEEESGNLNSSVLGFVTAGNPWAMTAVNMVKQLGSVRNGFVLVKTGAQMLGKQFVALMANPIVAFLALIATGISILVKGIKGSEDNMNRWRVAMAPLGVALDFISNLITGLASGILTVIETGGKLLGWIGKMCESIPILGEAFQEQNQKIQERVELQKSQIEYEQKTRAEVVKSAEREKAISELRAKVTDKEKYSAKERKGALEEAIKLEREQADEKKQLAELNLKNLELEASLAENDAEMNNKLAEAKAAVIRADIDYNNKIREMNAQRSELNNQIVTEEKTKTDAAKKAAEDAIKIRKEKDDKEIEAIRQAEDAMLSLIKDGIEKQRRQIILSYNREIEDLKKKLKEEKNLTQKAKDAINQTIKAKEQERINELQKLSDEEVQKNIEKETKRISLLLATVKKGSEAEYQLKLQQLMKQEEAELAAANSEIASVEEREATKLAIRQKYNLLNDELMESHDNSVIQKQQKVLKLEFETKIAAAGNDEVQVLQLKMEQKRVELESIQQLEGESIQEFNLRKLQAQNEYNDSKQSLTDKEVEIEQTKYQAVESIVGGLGSLTETLGEKNTTFAKLSKVLALGEIAVNTGKAIAAGVAQAQSVPFPGNMAAIATTIATVLANIATATKTVKSAKFAKGGDVVGPGSGTSDSIPAMLSNGESVMTAAATSMFSPMLSAFNQMGGGIPINATISNNQTLGEDMLAKAVAKGMAMAPSPVLSVEEYTTVSNRVKYLENLGSV